MRSIPVLGFVLVIVTSCSSSPEPRPHTSVPPPTSAAGAPSSAVTQVATAATSVAPSPLGAPSGAFGFNRVHESCNSFSAHITNASQTAWLDVVVDVKSLGLAAGTHRLPIDGKSVRLEITELAAAFDGEWWCTDIGGGSRSAVTARWQANGGTLRVHLHLPAANAPDPPYDGPYDRVDIGLDDVRFVDGKGNERRVTRQFEGLRIGWMPG